MKNKPKQEANYWKVATLVLAIICLSLIILSFYQEKKANPEYSSDGFSIDNKSISSLGDYMESGKVYSLCNLETKKCVGIGKR